MTLSSCADMPGSLATFLPLVALGVWLWLRPALKHTIEKLPVDKTRPSGARVADALVHHPDPRDDRLFFLRRL